MIEKERKFLFEGGIALKNPMTIQQGYLMLDGDKHLRVRVIDGKSAYLTFKIIHEPTFRSEYEYEIPLNDGVEMLESTKIKLQKIRYKTEFEGNSVDIDFYPDGLKIIEIEFENELINIPSYCGREITDEKEYSNIYIALKNQN
jgi:CYTH domain-containing protein